jgi:antitoxin FitA
MEKLLIDLPEKSLAHLREMAALLGISPEELARAGIEDLLVRPEEDFERAVEHVLHKNAELYSRLA